jgi:predicted RNase H-like HicB family nuclease
MRDLSMEAREDKVDGGFVASAIGDGIHTQAETLDELRARIMDAVNCYFAEPDEAPTVVHLRIISEEVLVK